MKISELEKYLSENRLLSVHVKKSVKKYMAGEKFWDNNVLGTRIDVYGIYKNPVGEYCFFITDSERGVFQYAKTCKTEEACEALITKITRCEYIYKMENNL